MYAHAPDLKPSGDESVVLPLVLERTCRLVARPPCCIAHPPWGLEGAMGRGEGKRVRSASEANSRASGQAERRMRIGRHQRAGLGPAREEAPMTGAGSGSGATTPHRTVRRTTLRRLPRATPPDLPHLPCRVRIESRCVVSPCLPRIASTGLAFGDRRARRGEGRCGHGHHRDGGGGRGRHQRMGWLMGARARCTASGSVRRWKAQGEDVGGRGMRTGAGR
jgi:hypothetical protein